MVQSLCSCKTAAFLVKCDNAADATETATPTNTTANEAIATPGWLIFKSSKTILPAKKNPASQRDRTEIDFNKEAFCAVKDWSFPILDAILQL